LVHVIGFNSMHGLHALTRRGLQVGNLPLIVHGWEVEEAEELVVLLKMVRSGIEREPKNYAALTEHNTLYGHTAVLVLQPSTH